MRRKNTCNRRIFGRTNLIYRFGLDKNNKIAIYLIIFSGKRQGPVFASSDKKAIFEQDIF